MANQKIKRVVRMLDYVTLKFIWFLLIGILMIGFAITGGFDLGVGALLPFLGKNDEDRRIILNSIGPTWEGNQVWLITAAAALFAAWPLMYATFFSTLYIAFLLVLVALILRPPGIDFRSKLPSLRWRSTWDYALCFSGFVPIFLFGIAFGNMFAGFPFRFDNTMMSHSTGGFWQLLTPYTLVFGVASASLLLLHGALFIQFKTTELLNRNAARFARRFALLFILSFLIALYWTLYKIEGFQIISMPDPNLASNPLSKKVALGVGFWLKNFQQYPLGILAPIFSMLGVILAFGFSIKERPGLALICNAFAIMSVIVTALFTLFPFVLPSISFPDHSLTVWNSVSSQLTLAWMFWATIILLPIVICYTSWVYWVMRGKVVKDHIETHGKSLY